MTLTDVLWAIETKDRLIEASKMGIHPFSECERYPRNSIFYDDKSPKEAKDGSVLYPVVDGYSEQSHRIISTYGTEGDDFRIKVSVKDDPFVGWLAVEMDVQCDSPSAFEFSDITYTIYGGKYTVC